MEAYRRWLIVRFIRRDCSFLKPSSIFKMTNKSISELSVVNKYQSICHRCVYQFTANTRNVLLHFEADLRRALLT